MDSLDSASSTLSIYGASREGSSSTDQEGMISVTAAMAREAAVLFHSRKYAECVDVLLHLSQKKQDDPKVLHNIAISVYFRDGCSDPKKLLELLNNVKTSSEELERTSAEQADTGGNKIVSGFKGTSAMSNQVSSASSKSVVYADEFGSSVASLNMAVIWFHLHEYNKAMTVLEPLYQNIGPIDETVALHICLLMLDAALASHDASKSADLIKYLDKLFNVGLPAFQGDNGGLGQQQSLNFVLKSSSFQASSMETSVVTDSASENSLSRTLSEEPIDYENLFSTLDIGGGDNLLRPSSDLLRTLIDRTIPTIDLKLKLQLCKIQFLLLTRNLKSAKREVKEAMNMARGRDSSMALLLKSHLEYARGNQRKAIKLLMASSSGIDSSLFNNNFGCIYYQLGKYHTSNVFYKKALSNSSSLRKEKPRNLLSFSQDKSLLITYNCGMQYLVCGNPILAARCFHKASSVFYNRPLLWLRIAECCLMALNFKSEIAINVIGTGKWRQLSIEDAVVLKSIENRDDDDKEPPNLSVPFARQCLVNALYLLETKSGNSTVENNICEAEAAAQVSILNPRKIFGNGGDAKEQKGGIALNDLLINSISDYEEICKKDNRMIKEAVLANMGYVELELENPLKALSTATSLLNIPECSRMYTFLGHVYAAEALCLLNRPKEAAEHLAVYLSEGANKLELPYREDECVQWTLESEDKTPPVQVGGFLNPEEARGTLYVNLAAMTAMQGDLDLAHQFAKQALSSVPESREAVLTAVYIDVRLGKTQDALAKLKKSRNVRFVNSKLSLNKSL